MKKAILLIEDDEDLIGAMSTALTNHDYLVIVAHDAREAILKLKNQEFACVITDIRLAASSGEEVIEFLRKTKKIGVNEAVPILVVSGFLDRPLLERLSGQVNGALVKPFPMEELLKKLQTVGA
jgi:DNA-binding response OmpR family regulator